MKRQPLRKIPLAAPAPPSSGLPPLRPPPLPPEGFPLAAGLGSLPPYRLAAIQIAAQAYPKRYIELGCHLSDTCLAVLAAFPNCEVVGIDWFKQAAENTPYWQTGDKFSRVDQDWQDQVKQLSRIALKRFEERAVALAADIETAAKYQPEDSADAVYLDASYDAQSVYRHLQAWWPKVRRGGVIFGREWDASQPGQPDHRTGVRAAVDAFCKPTQTPTTPMSERRDPRCANRPTATCSGGWPAAAALVQQLAGNCGHRLVGVQRAEESPAVGNIFSWNGALTGLCTSVHYPKIHGSDSKAFGTDARVLRRGSLSRACRSGLFTLRRIP